MADRFDDLPDDALHAYLTNEAKQRGEHLVIEERDGEWVAAFHTETGLGGEVIPLPDGEGAVILPDTAGTMGSGWSPDRRTAMLRLAHRHAAGFG